MAVTAARSARAAAREMRSRAIPHTTDAPSARVVWALARVEAWKMLRHPAYLVAFGLSVVLFGGLRGSQIQLEVLLLGTGVGLMIGTLLAANLGALRSRRDGTDELFGSVPSPPAARTAAHLAGVWVGPALVGCGWAALVLAFDRAYPSKLPEDFRPLVLVQTPFVIGALGALGVATARWIPHAVGGAVIIALHMFTPLVWALPWVIYEQDLDPNLWHLAYLLSVTVAFSSAAFLRDRTRALPAATFVLGLGIAIVSAFQRVPEGGW